MTDHAWGGAVAPRTLHVLNGDSAATALRESGIEGVILSYPDVLYDGPVPAGLDDAAFRDVRARFLSAAMRLSYDDVRRGYEERDAALAGAGAFDEVVLWFEHDLYDQLLLVRHLDWFARHPPRGTALTLICIGSFPGVHPFHGLGQLSPTQLASLAGARRPVGPEQLELGGAAWRAFTAGEPARLEHLARDGTPALPFLAGALRRFLEEFPWTEGGLPRTERQALAALAGGPLSPRDLFSASQANEERVFLGDWSFWWRIRELAAGPAPLVSLRVEGDAGPSLPAGTVHLGERGRAVLEGRDDWTRLGFDRWMGGLHLVARDARVPWRWDARAGRLVGE
ncbi:MAG TPA: DUF1835 domain-containing protein [Gemmatimonadaceae bacterium]